MMVRERTSFVALVLALVCFLTAAAPTATPQKPLSSTLFDAPQLLADLKVLSADDMEGRQAGTPGNEKARAFVIRRFKQAGVLPFKGTYEYPFPLMGRARSPERRGTNVVGFIEGTRSSGRYIVLSAHYDHIGTRNGQVFNGADDNASGTAALFTLAKYFSEHRPLHSLIFASFDAEEIGLQGSREFVQNPPVAASRLAVNLNFDMIGRESENRLFVVGAAAQPVLKPFIQTATEGAPTRLIMGHEDPRQPEDWTRDSDHYSFMEAGIPALYFGVEDFEQHHKATDDYETITFDFYVRAVETLVRVVKEFDANLDSLKAPAR